MNKSINKKSAPRHIYVVVQNGQPKIAFENLVQAQHYTVYRSDCQIVAIPFESFRK